MRRSAVSLAAFVVLVAACGGGDREGRTVTTKAGGAVRVVAKEYSFDPSTIVVRGPGAVRFTLKNDGSLAHDIRVLNDGKALGGTQPFPPGKSESATVRLEPGEYEFICTVGDHAELGMKGKLTVR